MDRASYISRQFQIDEKSVANTISLLDEGATIPFISRYRKERTGGLDEVQIGIIADLSDKCKELDKRRETILATIEEQGKLTPELKARIESCTEMTVLEDIYLPFKPKRRTRAQVAREKGLEPLAAMLMKQETPDPQRQALRFVNGEVSDKEEALQGACDIISEWVSENERSRNTVRGHFRREAVITSKVVKGKEQEGEKYRDYFNFSEPLKRCSSHRYLAICRGAEEGVLRFSISPDDERCIEDLEGQYIKRGGSHACAELVGEAVCDGFKRLIKPSIETEFANMTKEKADDEAILIFAENLQQLLMAAPLGQKRIMGIDPGFRTGCKVVCLDAQGKLLHNEAIFPHEPQRQWTLAAKKVAHLVESYDIQAIAIGNGTASRETESFIKSIRFDRTVQVFVVSENGASVYSASPIAREEFPQYDVTVRGAVSIGRRLGDPLAELVKIDPKSIGVGQYQHDVDQSKLRKSLENTVVHCVNAVGVNLNTASKWLLTYVSGLNSTAAQNIVAYRDENGPFSSRNELKKVPRIGPKAFEQAAGFLRIPQGSHPLDNTAVHPERYALVEKMAADLHCSIEELIRNPELRRKIDLQKYITAEVGMPTLNDIMQELSKPGRDPRTQVDVFEFDSTIHDITDLKEGMILPGIVTNITAFGAFVDIGIHENGLLHISEMADHFVKSPSEVVKLHQHLQVKVIGVDLARKRIQLSLKP